MDSAILWMRKTVSRRKSVRHAVFLSLCGCGKNGIYANGLAVFAYFMAVSGLFLPKTLPSTLLLLDKRHHLSRLRVAVKVWSSKFVDSHKFP